MAATLVRLAQSLFVLGVNHRTAPVAVREQLAFAEDEIVPSLSLARAEIASAVELAMLSTCNRVEFIGTAGDPASTIDEIVEFIARRRSVSPELFASALYKFQGRDAIRHLFRVSCSLDSMVVGEPQILGQMKIAYAQAAQAGSIGMVLHRAFHKAFGAAKRVRKTTLIGHGSVSVSSAAVNLARRIFDSLKDKKVMLLGAGKMAELTARQLSRLGIESLLISNRTFDKAAALARELRGTVVPFENYLPYLKIADIVIGSVATARPILNVADFDPIMRERKYRPIFLIDLGVPRNFSEALNSLDNVYLYDVDDLASAVIDSRGEREREAQKAGTIVELEIESFHKWLSNLELVPAIKDIRSGIERMREAELKRHRAWLAALQPEERKHVEDLTRGIVNKILHQVLTELRRKDGAVENAHVAEIARRMLGADLLGAGETGGDDASDSDDEDEI
jgi:glutamyl-tRNA reductase